MEACAGREFEVALTPKQAGLLRREREVAVDHRRADKRRRRGSKKPLPPVYAAMA
jgi:hypothetical protein